MCMLWAKQLHVNARNCALHVCIMLTQQLYAAADLLQHLNTLHLSHAHYNMGPPAPSLLSKPTHIPQPTPPYAHQLNPTTGATCAG